MHDKILVRLMSKIIVDPATGCWEWLGYTDRYGYGSMNVNSYPYKTHRLSYALHHDGISAGMLICHKCDNRKCCNPDHLFEGTHADNIHDMISKGRHTPIENRRGEKHGSAKFSAEDVQYIRDHYVPYKGGTSKELAARFNTSCTTISAIARGRQRKYG